jgi:type IV pilus assembly protein PilQ
VLIGARVLEVRLDNESSLGVDWASIFGAGEATVDLSTSGFSLTPESGSHGVFATIGSRDVTAFLDALREVVDFEALSAPQVLVLEGKEAEIIVGGKLGFYITTTTQTSTIQSVEFLDIGSLLTLTPIISDDGHIQMKIHPKVSDGVVENGLPSETTTEVTTQVLVADGETLFIGGLIRRRAQDSHSGVPLLGQIPYLGSLFGRHGDTAQRTEVVVLITPRVVKPGDPRATQPLELDPPQP